jgi:hypothetical protein
MVQFPSTTALIPTQRSADEKFRDSVTINEIHLRDIGQLETDIPDAALGEELTVNSAQLQLLPFKMMGLASLACTCDLWYCPWHSCLHQDQVCCLHLRSSVP